MAIPTVIASQGKLVTGTNKVIAAPIYLDVRKELLTDFEKKVLAI